MNNQPQNIQIKIDDETLKGKYSNMMQIAHNKEVFVLDFMNVLPPNGIVVSRVLTNPGHLKRLIKAMQDNLARYEETFGEIKEAESPIRPVGFDTQK